MKKNQKTGLTFSDLENLPCSIRYFKKPITIKIVVPDNRFTLKAKEIKLKIYKKIEYIIGGPISPRYEVYILNHKKDEKKKLKEVQNGKIHNFILSLNRKNKDIFNLNFLHLEDGRIRTTGIEINLENIILY